MVVSRLESQLTTPRVPGVGRGVVGYACEVEYHL